ncbi:MAG: copper chaperone PCu(A)C [Betaproteobacteria bacterium]|nr:copper chaperone PCu(A)C [Betaproteobacteria bacterium]
MNIASSRLALMFAAVALSTATFAGEADFTVTDATVRAVPPGTPTSLAFMTIRNDGAADRKLVKADSPVAKTVELHNHINDNGVMRMRQVKEIEIKAKGQAELKTGSYHVMLIDLKQTLKEGDSVPITLIFDDGSRKKIDVPVKKAQAMMPMGGEMDHSKMKH